MSMSRYSVQMVPIMGHSLRGYEVYVIAMLPISYACWKDMSAGSGLVLSLR